VVERENALAADSETLDNKKQQGNNVPVMVKAAALGA